MEEQNRRERREKEREYWFQDSLLSLSCCVFPAARSPRIGHLQDCAVVPERPAALWGTTTSISIHPYLRSSFWSLSFPQTRSLLILRFSSCRRNDDWLTDIHFPLLFSQLSSYCSPVFTLKTKKKKKSFTIFLPFDHSLKWDSRWE
jgi:hypothetical protein